MTSRYDEAYRRAMTDPEGFWAEAAEAAGIHVVNVLKMGDFDRLSYPPYRTQCRSRSS